MTHSDPLDLQGQEAAEADREEKRQQAALQEAEDFKWLMADKRGRRIIWGLLEKTGMYRSSFTGNSETFFREGQRNVGLMLTALLHEHCAERYATMITEHQSHDSKRSNDRRKQH